MDEILLMLPGPTTVHPRVLNAMSQAVVNHRGAKYGEILTETSELMSDVFQTSNQSYLLTGSGTAAMEAAISNVVNSGEKILNVVLLKLLKLLLMLMRILKQCLLFIMKPQLV